MTTRYTDPSSYIDIIDTVNSHWGMENPRRCIVHLLRYYDANIVRACLIVADAKRHIPIFDKLSVLL